MAPDRRRRRGSGLRRGPPGPGRPGGDRVQRAQDGGALDQRGEQAAVEGQPQEPGCRQHRQRGEERTQGAVHPAPAGTGQQADADRLADPVADRAAEHAAHDQDQDRAQRLGVGGVDLEPVEDGGRDGRPQDHAHQQAHVLGQGEPEAAARPAGHGEHEGAPDDEVEEAEPQRRAPLRRARAGRCAGGRRRSERSPGPVRRRR